MDFDDIDGATPNTSSKAIIAILSKTRPIARMVLLTVRLFVRPTLRSIELLAG